MTAMAEGRIDVNLKLNAGDRYRDFIVAAGETIYPGAYICLNAAGAAIAGAIAGVTGVGWYTGPNTLTAGDTVRVHEGEGYMKNDGAFTAANVGDPAYLVDDQTVDATDTSCLAGVITGVDSTLGVRIASSLVGNTILATAIAGANP